MPTALPIPWPKGPVVVSMPMSKSSSGWPGVLDPNCLKFFKSWMLKLYPVRCNKLYKSIDP